ncbi:ROBO1-like protein [Mya arenaria]|uniref:ROBO1-like protein n=1 Tax=Mya arenaria TaxID=6604 RepID=A0ABY7E2N9_MYAAR|nr:ROBO1-like protein [Mya arenaria]
MPNPRITEQPMDSYFAKNLPATLDCKAEGEPTPTISWYQNDRKIVFDSITNYNDNTRMIVDQGRLFMLQFLHTKNRTYTGTYYCVATNSHGTAQSRTAFIDIAVIRDDFREEPVDKTVPLDSRTVLGCRPPRGEPEPIIDWLHDGKPVTKGDRISILGNGDLVFSNVNVDDGGEYICVASNIAGKKKSSPVTLTVLEVPEITRYPEPLTVDEGDTVEFHCAASGGGDVRVGWRREGGASRKNWRVLADHTLQISRVEVEDMGTYVCTAENGAGAVEAVAHLKVEYTPKILIRPSDQTAAVGRTISLPCSAIGNPKPTIYWETTAKTVTELMFEKNLYADGRMSVSLDGTLRMVEVARGDAGRYTCKAISSKGKAEAEATLTVQAGSDVIFPENDLRPPPIIRFGPQNQTLPRDGVAFLRCQATGTPQPTIHWLRNDLPLPTDARYMVLDSGTLQISTPEKPVVSDVTNTSVRLSWLLVRITDNTPIMGYVVEYFEYGSSQSWQSADRLYVQKDVIITGLKPDTTYVFLVRAVNSYGTGGPSPLSDKIRTLEPNMGQPLVPEVNLPSSEIENRLRNVNEILNMGSGQPPEYGQAGGQRASYRPLSHTLTGLESYQYYEICVKATSGERTSPCSPPWLIQTGESVPSSPPGNVVVEREGDSVIIVTWAPPDRAHRHGKITGYKIKCMSVDEQQNCSRQVNGTTNRVRIDGLTAGVQYNIELAAETLEGVGSWSTVYAIGSGDSSVTKERWFIGSIGALGGVVWLGLCIFTCWLCRSRKRRKKLKEQWYSNGGQASNEKQHVSIELREGNKSSAGDSGHQSDENGMLIKQGRKGPGYRPGIGPGPGVVNWNEMLPPPPVHPPSDTEYNPDDALYSEIPEDRSRSPHLPAQNSSCSCPVSAHPQPVSAGPYPGSYSENCNRCQSLRNFDSRPYSPQQLIQLHRQHSQGCQPHHARAQTGSQRGPGGTPMYMHGYAQPWDSQPLPRGPYDYELAKVPQEGGYNYTQPIQDGLIKHSNTLNSRGGQGWRPHPGDGQLPYMGAPVCDSANIPGGPPGNYCEGPCRGQGDTLNSINSGYHRNLSDNGQLPYLEGYMIESPPSSGTGSDYRVCNSGGSQAGSGGDSGRSRSTGIQGQPAQYPHRMFQSGPVDEGFARNTDSPISEDPEACDTETESQRDSLVAHWESVGEGSDVHSSSEAEGSGEDGEGGNILTEEDFASAVARAAQLSGLTVVGSTVTDPNHNQKQDFDAASVPHPAPSSPDPLPSLYRPRPTETTPTNKPSPMFQFSDDIPVV